MEVTTYAIAPESYHRYKTEATRISDIIKRARQLWLERIRQPIPNGKEIDPLENVKIYVCERQGSEKLNLNDENLVMNEHGILKQTTYKYKSTESFLTRNRDNFGSITILVFRYHQHLLHELKNFATGPSVMIVKHKRERPKAYKLDNLLQNITMVSSDDNFAEEICLLLEQIAFNPMKEWFERISSLFQDKKRDCKTLSGHEKCTETSNRSENQRKFDETKGIKTTKIRATTPVVHGKQMVNKKAEKGNCISTQYYFEKTNGQAKVTTRSQYFTSNHCGYKRNFDEMKESNPTASSNDPFVFVQQIDTKSRNGNYSGDSFRKMNGHFDIYTSLPNGTSYQTRGKRRKLNIATENDHSKRKESKLSSSKVNSEVVEIEIKKKVKQIDNTSSGGYDPENEEMTKGSLVENKAKFQRLLGEMTGMYRRSKIPECSKPQFDGSLKKEKIDQIMKKMYQKHSSVKGYSFKFILRLQIHVLSEDIEKLRPEIAREFDNHGITQDSYDIVPPLDDVTPCNQILVGSKVTANVPVHGSLGGIVKTTKENEKSKICALASKHILRGRETVELSNSDRKLTATVIKETAPYDATMLFDIAAAEVQANDIIHCEGRFKTEGGTFMKGVMCDKDDFLLECQPVHIYGASTPLGLGIIATTQYSTREENEEKNEDKRFIYIDKRKPDEPFCVEGDSGAMVCADNEDGNHVELISTVNGKAENGLISTLRIQDGISHLRSVSGRDIKFL